MARSAFVMLAWRTDHVEGGTLEDLQRRLTAAGWRCAAARSGIAIWTLAEGGLPVTPLPAGRGWIVGEHYSTPEGPPLSPGAEVSGARLANRLSRTHWGRFVAILPETSGFSAYREPSGHLAAHAWTLKSGIVLLASDPTRLPPGFSPPRLALDWSRIATFLASQGAATTEQLLSGMVSIGPGELLRAEGGSLRVEPIWRPATFARDALVDVQDAKREMVSRVDACVAAMARGRPTLLMELSGGLDSAIVATSLGATGETDRVACWLNFAGDRIEGDERTYATAVTDRLGVPLTVAKLSHAPLEPADFEELGSRLWPAVAGADAGRDRRVLQALAETGATALMSGQGGDAVFFQMPSALVFADAFARDGLRALGSPLLADVARRTRTSAWTVAFDAYRTTSRAATGQDDAAGLVARDVREAGRGQRHAWASDAESQGLAPGKQLQILAIANCHAYHGESRRGARADLLYPLLAQPVVELALGIGIPELAGGAFDRPFARDAFRERLPEAILRRRAKGRLGAYFAHLVSASADGLRSYLLDGVLAEAGLLDRGAVTRILDPDQLIWAGRPAEVLRVAAAEAWVRHWQTRVADAVSTARRMG